ncbi:putative transcription factor WD40-like family [Medicago truncatula]|uniref:Putative transcription factor WD40-like family n=1 Tax=Medicago truncatula TaxID=3880 RepID=G7L189_MEDTR|nr:transcriptional corepressor LEUNIG_HOMOLOG isoform X1 [Medicago truncatula]XP_024627222.1 transcriptional corepressor LEUNIG_HOMOLOG isoform X1 [Medicago truncatula]XP_039683643.1 transcriptional corepressor LEUNIG_HOMOLOG isoform X1 [Medicago truncatula]AES79145.1 transcriptional corepressor leunig-like protein [Medicago truncatula]RHN45977.1 putative transcription factor WD40-like family [Medicago truncatula]
MKPTLGQAQSNWEADKVLDVYIHDYFLKRRLHNTAKAFMAEGKVSTDPVAIDAPGGFLFEWWSVFWDIFISRTNEKHSEAAASYIETQQTKVREQPQIQQLQRMQQRNAQLQRRDPNHPGLGGSLNPMNSEGMLGQPPAGQLAMKMYEARMKHPHSIDANRMALLKSATSHQGQLVHGNSGNMSAVLQQMQARSALNNVIKREVKIGASPMNFPMDSSVYRQSILQSKSGLGRAGLNQGVTCLPLKGWPLNGIGQLRPGLGVQVPKPNLTSQNQYLLASQQQQVLAQAQAQQNSLGNSNYGDMDPRRLSGLPRGSLNPKDGQSNWNDGSISSQMQSGSPKMKMAQTQQSLSQQQEQLQQHQLQQSNRKRKQASSSGAANSTGTRNTAGPSPYSPSSTHTPGDALNTASSMEHVNNVQKSMMMYGTEATGGLRSSSNLLDDIDGFGDVGALDDNVESFLSNDAGDGGNLYGTIKQSPAEEQKDSSKTYTFAEFSCIRTRNIVTSCHFSSDGKLLASAGEDKKVTLWNMDSLRTEHTPEEHKLVITDVRFRPNSSQLATASCDKSVRLWDAVNPTYCVQEYSGHSSAIMSLDFHPKKTDIFCFCDNENEIRYYNITSSSCTRVSKGGNAKVRFQPGSGQLLAAASDKVVSIFDVETDRQIYSLQGHPEPVNNICWDTTGDMLASISPNLVKIWNLTSGECVQELNSTGNQFYSGLFHPSYATLLVVGGISSLELWNMAENKSMTIPAHENVISALAECAATGMVASASRDNSVKLWK